MSKRHNASRRKAYGRRQHEVTERRHRDYAPDGFEAAHDDLGPLAMSDRFGFLDPRTPRLRFAHGD